MPCIDSYVFGIDTSLLHVSVIKLWIDTNDFGIDTWLNDHSGILLTYSMHRCIRIVYRYKLLWYCALHRFNRVLHRSIVEWSFWNSFYLQYASMHTCLYRFIHVKQLVCIGSLMVDIDTKSLLLTNSFCFSYK